MILHFQKKDLGLKLTGDQRIERKFDINNKAAIMQSEAKNFVVANLDELGDLHQKDISKWPKYVVMHKKMRKIEQETRIQREDFDQLYEVTSKKKEKSSKKDPVIQEKEEKLQKMNQEFEKLKNR